MDVSRAYIVLRILVREVDDTIKLLKRRDAVLYEKVVRAHQNGDVARANMYANEVAELRKLIESLLTAKLALEKVVERLERVMKGSGNVNDIAVAATVVSELASQLSYTEPLVAIELKNIADTLLPTGDEEAKKILEEAAREAEHRLEEELPELP